MRHWVVATIVMLCSSIAFAQDAKVDSKVTLKKLIEKRELSLEKNPFSGWENGIDLTLHVDGPSVKGARQVGMIQIKQAVDDAGTDLTKKGEDAPMRDLEQFQDVREPQNFGFGNNAPKPSGFDLDIKLSTPSARTAKSLKTLTGQFQVIIGGEKKEVTVKSLKTHTGKPLDDPALKAAGITFTIGDPAKVTMGSGEKGKDLPVTIKGDLAALGEVTVADASGEKLNNGSMWNDMGGARSITYSLNKVLPDDAVLTIEVFPGQKKITVPFEIKDVKLP
jgi:hypothetical protein